MTQAIDIVRSVLVAAAATAQFVMGGWPQWRKWENSVADRSERLHLPMVPWPPFFAIWALIFAASFGFAIWHALPQNLDDSLLRDLGWYAIAAWTLNAAWEWHVPRRDIDWISALIITLALFALLEAMRVISSTSATSGAQFWLAVAPIQLLAGWLTAAAWVNVGSALKWSGFAVRSDWQITLLLGAALLGSAVSWMSGSLVYAGAIAWALVGIVVQNVLRDRNLAIGAVAALCAPAIIIAALVSTA